MWQPNCLFDYLVKNLPEESFFQSVPFISKKNNSTASSPPTNQTKQPKQPKNQKGILWLAVAVPPCIHQSPLWFVQILPPLCISPLLSSTCTGHQSCFNSNQVVSSWHSGSSGFIPASLNLQNRCIIPAWVHCHWLFRERMSVKCPEEPSVLQAVWHRSRNFCTDAASGWE